ncbi:hypothetical protein J7438_20675 [Thalassotalea sp. G20_0]|uniref:hypothetical protein n=1 Tax=Thalassotalea sp. G20_0 TaxID=2821093 RepID=UPI001ADBC5C6|nr:hypothetical protein [Thalassotalea sp. G20_0]MBO9496476.1 hypothetical protein [Thalassotalea sp. G20_0]
MDRCNTGSNFFTISSCLQNPPESPLVPSGTPSSKQGVTGYSTQTRHSLHYGYLRQDMMNQGMPSSLRSLDDFSISQLPSPESESVLPQLSLEDLDQILSCGFSREPVDDDFVFTDLTLTNVQPIAQKLPPINSLIFSQPSSRPVAMVGSLIKDTHEQVTTETTEFNVPESSGGSVEPLPLTLSVAHQQTDK